MVHLAWGFTPLEAKNGLQETYSHCVDKGTPFEHKDPRPETNL